MLGGEIVLFLLAFAHKVVWRGDADECVEGWEFKVVKLLKDVLVWHLFADDEGCDASVHEGWKWCGIGALRQAVEAESVERAQGAPYPAQLVISWSRMRVWREW